MSLTAIATVGYTPIDHPGARSHLNYLRERAIPVELANQAGIHFVTEKSRARYAELLGTSIPCDALYIPYINGVGTRTYWRLRLLDPSENGPKALAPASISPPPYIPTTLTTGAQWAPTVPRFFVESAQKALALLAIGYTAIGLAGVSVGFHDPAQWKAARFLDLHPELAGRVWQDVPVYLVPDAGVTKNPSVALATAKLARILFEAGSLVRLVILPHHGDEVFGEQDQGPDDFIYRKGADAFRELVAAGLPAAPHERAAHLEETAPERLAVLGHALLRDLTFQAGLAVGAHEEIARTVEAFKKIGVKSITRAVLAEKVEQFNRRVAAKGTANVPADLASKLRRTAGGNIISSFDNAATVMVHDPKWAEVLAFDAFAGRICVAKKKSAPWAEEVRANAVEAGSAWIDTDNDRLVDYLGRSFGIAIKRESAFHVARLAAQRHTYHPVRDYLRGLRHDGVARIDEWLITYAGAPETPYVRRVSRYALMQAVARILRPGCKADYVLILEGEQGRGKSSLVEALSPDAEWVSDAPLKIGDKDTLLAMVGKWLIEIAEAAALLRYESEETKAFITKKVDRYRSPYGVVTEDHPRQSVFIASINPSEGYLRDATGNRRHWPVPVERVDLDGLRAGRDQLWAEAVALVEAGERYWPDENEDSLFADEQSIRQERDPWHDTIEDALAEYNETTTAWILTNVVDITTIERHDQKAKNRVAKILTSTKWKSFDAKPKGEDRRTVRVYRRTANLVQKPKAFDLSAAMPTSTANGTAPTAMPAFGPDMTMDDV
jgi:predicted P-loop ATPase